MSPNRRISKQAPPVHIERRILVIRARKILLDTDLAGLYGVTTSALVQAVKRNLDRFPDDFMFQLDTDEWEALRSQSVISNVGCGGRRHVAELIRTRMMRLPEPNPSERPPLNCVIYLPLL